MNTLAKHSFVLVLFTAVTIPLGYIIRILYASNLSITEFGLLYALVSLFSFIAIVNDLGFSEAQGYFIPKYLAKGEYKKVKTTIIVGFINQIFWNFIFSAGYLVLLPVISSHYFRLPSYTQVIGIMIMYFVLSNVLMNITTLFYSLRDVFLYGSVETARLLLILAGVYFVFTASSMPRLLSVSIVWLAVYTILIIFYFLLFILRHKRLFQGPIHSPQEIYREFIPFLLPTALRKGAHTLLDNTSVLMLTYIKGVEAVALYSIAQPIANIIFLFSTPISALFLPATVDMFEKEQYGQISKVLSKVLNLFSFFSFPFLYSVILYAREILLVVFGEKYVSATITLQLFIMYIALVVFNSFISSFIAASGFPKERLKITGISALLHLFISYVAISASGSVGAVGAGIITNIVLMYLGISLLKKKIPFSISSIPLARLLSVAVLYIFLVHALATVFNIASLLKVIVTSGIAYVCYLYVGIYILHVIDKKIVFDMLSRIKKR